MKHYALFLITMLLSFSLLAQTKQIKKHHRHIDPPPQADKEDGYPGVVFPPDTAKAIYTYIEQMPRFNGSMKQFVQNNFHYPQQLNDSFIYARVVVRFLIDTLGNVTNPEIIRHVHPAIDSEILRLVRAMPPWQPGKNNGKTVPVAYALPFIIDSECRCVQTKGLE